MNAGNSRSVQRQRASASPRCLHKRGDFIDAVAQLGLRGTRVSPQRLAGSPPVDPEPAAPETGVRLCELSLETCRWPCWQDGELPPIAALKFCGATPVNGSHTAAHMLRWPAARLNLPQRSHRRAGRNFAGLRRGPYDLDPFRAFLQRLTPAPAAVRAHLAMSAAI
jgi:hypothetical protein